MIIIITIILMITSSEMPDNINSYRFSIEEGQTITMVKEEDDFWSMSTFEGEEKYADAVKFKIDGSDFIIINPEGEDEPLVKEGMISKFEFRELSSGEKQIFFIDGSTEQYIGNYTILKNRIEMIFEEMTPQKLNIYFE